MPGKGAFKRCVAKVAAKGRAVDPRAVCATAGRRKYGAKKFAAMAAAGRKKAAVRHNKSKGTWDVISTHTPAGGSTIRRTVKTFKSEPAAQRFADKWNDRATRTAGGMAHVSKRNPRNPLDTAAERYKDFHGEPAKDTYSFTEDWHYHGVTAQVGMLVSLKIRVPKLRGGGEVTVKGFKGARLTMNEAGTQLYVEDGDQALDLASFGIKRDPPHDREYLGECVEVTYHTTKAHLGKDGGDANYVHRFGRIEGGDKTERPQMLYDVLNEEIIFAGGGYTIPSEGIDG